MKYTASKLEELRREAELNLQHITKQAASFEITLDFELSVVRLHTTWYTGISDPNERSAISRKIGFIQLLAHSNTPIEDAIASMLSKVEASV